MSRLLCIGCIFACFASARPSDQAESFNCILGTQAIGGRYQFTKDTRIVESAKLIRALGSNLIKVTFSHEGSFGEKKGNVPAHDPAIQTLTDLATKESSHKAVLDMPFTYCLLWVYPLTSKTQANTFRPEDHDRQYRELYDFACHLLRTYSGTGKQFYLGHWEGDWHLRSHFDPKKPIPDGAGERFTEWLRVRQRAIDDAKRDTPHHDVALWHYTEVNLVEPFLKGGQCLTNDILPQVDVDFVSYSCYDAIQKDIHEGLFTTLSYIESKLKAKPGIQGKRVFIGEYGFPTRRYTPDVQNQKSIEAMIAGLEWGCPFVLYWELYDNEGTPEKLGGFWLINGQNEKQPIWHTHERYYQWARGFVRDTITKTGLPPEDAVFRKAAVEFLKSSPVFISR